MNFFKTELEGVFLIENFNAQDERGSFTKTYHLEEFEKNNIFTQFKESYFSKSKKNVIRGMHFQLPPHDHDKLVYVASGEVLDVILDLRSNSATFGKSISINLSDKNNRSVYIPKGLAHGFKSLVDDTIMVYNVSTTYNSTADAGVLYSSFDFDWGVESLIISERDLKLKTLKNFLENNPF